MQNAECKMKNGIVFTMLALMSLVFAVPTFAQKETPPEGGPPKAFVFPKQDTYTLPNGMQVTLVQYGSVPKVAYQAAIYAGTKDDAKGKKALSEMVGSMLKEGTKSRTADVIALDSANMGGSINVGTGTDSTLISGEVLSEFDVKFVELLADVIRNPNFQQADLDRLKANKLRALAVARSQAQTLAWEKFRETVFADHPYAQINPRDEEVKSYSLADVRDFYNQFYGAARTHLYVVGKFDQAAVKAAIAKSFGDWTKGTGLTRNVPKVVARRSLQTINRADAPQSTIYMGVPAPSVADADYTKFVVMDAILGGAFASRITANIREDKGYTYSPGSFVWTRYGTGYWVEAADVTTDHTGDSLKEILIEINKLRNEPVSAAELQGIKNYLTGLYVLNNSARFGVIGQLENSNYNELSSAFIDNYVKNINAVTAADVQAMAKKYLTDDKLSIVVVGDQTKIATQLKPYEVQ
jgi:predicted Zn-dependent peptidase